MGGLLLGIFLKNVNEKYPNEFEIKNDILTKKETK